MLELDFRAKMLAERYQEKMLKCKKITISLQKDYNYTLGRHKQKGLNLLFFNFLTSAWSLAS